ncbi:MAG: cell division protein ZapA [Thioalkalivibrionaceae bacterium]
MSEMVPVKVNVLGKELQVGCKPAERAALFEAAGLVDTQMREVRDAGRVVGVDRIAILVALNLANELLALRAERVELERSIEHLEALADKVESLTAAQAKS